MRRGANTKRAREYDCFQASNRISSKIDSKITAFIESYKFKKPLKGSIKTECSSSIQHSGSPNKNTLSIALDRLGFRNKSFEKYKEVEKRLAE
jgi:hypothetical protein